MSNTQLFSVKKSTSKWLFAVVLLLSFFTFSGFVAQNQTWFSKPQTTLVVSSRAEVKKSISYKRASAPARFKFEVPSVFTDISRLHSHQVKIRIAALDCFSVLRQTGLFYRPKATSQNKNDAPATQLG